MSISHPSTHPILNPNLYLNYLPPKTAKQFEYARDLYLATLGALLWDILATLPDDLLLLRSGFCPALFAYTLSRSSALAYVLLSVVIKTHDVWHCKAIECGTTICWVLASASTSFLFFQRVKTVYVDKKYIRWGFFLLFLINVGVSCLVPIGSHLGRLANTGYCVSTGIEPYTAAATFFRLALDSSVYLAITFKVVTMQGISGESLPWSTIMPRHLSSRIVRAVLRSGQQYYLMCVCTDILVSALILTPAVPKIYQTMFMVPNLALYSSMACRVFRNLKITADKVDTAMSDLLFKRSAPLEFGVNTNRPSASMSTYLNSPTSTLHLPPPEVRIRSVSTTSLRLRDGEVERYSILKVKPVANAKGSTKATPKQNP
ncbi:hypothetical protein CVT25_015840 [Psilocybe cyanescens]|uniref:Glucose receptor Git3 N-terminal domain-containing protein n=1 Tax=Psilocybe cyanescens TaxID=93625 RepID=A0A409XT93_PSICY|nr:hypothetical protein CVT25_015840 [Psilocybe cyanescens]